MGISLLIKADSIYQDSIVEISATATRQFKVAFKATILNVISGTLNDKQNCEVVAIEKDGIYILSLQITGWFSEREVYATDETGPHTKYGMRFFPFVSSFLFGNLTTSNLPINTVILDLPDKFRLIWYGAEILNPNNVKGELKHSKGKDRSKYYFLWNDQNEQAGQYKFKIPVRIGGAELLRLTYFPAYYYILALCAVTLSAFADKVSILIAAIVGTWTFMLRHWGRSNLPQRNTLLTHLYIIAGIYIFIWGFAWKRFHFWALFLIIPTVILLVLFFQSLRKFNLEGILPSIVTKYWSRQIKKIDQIQADSWIK